MKINHRAANNSFGRKSKRNQTELHRGDWSPNSNQANSIGAGNKKAEIRPEENMLCGDSKPYPTPAAYNKPGAFRACGTEIPDRRKRHAETPGPEKLAKPTPQSRQAIFGYSLRIRGIDPQTKTPEIQGREGGGETSHPNELTARRARGVPRSHLSGVRWRRADPRPGPAGSG